MQEYTKKFIEENIQLIEDNNWKELWDKYMEKKYSKTDGEVAQVLIAAGINPLEGLDYIPAYFLSWSHVDSFTIPNNIKIIRDSAFYGTDMKGVLYIPDGVEVIESDAFGLNYDLEKVSLPSSLKGLGKDAFYGDTHIKSFEFRGTKKQWQDISNHSGWNTFSNINIIKCNDGEELPGN